MLPGNNIATELVQCVYISCHFKRYEGRVQKEKVGEQSDAREIGEDG